MNPSGEAAERQAAAYLESQGLKLVVRNYHCRFGEIDLVMRDGATLVFVEVRLRSHAAFGGAGGSITAAKRNKLIVTAQHYLQQHGDAPCRFDAVLLQGPRQPGGKAGNIDPQHIEWIRHAFDA